MSEVPGVAPDSVGDGLGLGREGVGENAASLGGRPAAVVEPEEHRLARPEVPGLERSDGFRRVCGRSIQDVPRIWVASMVVLVACLIASMVIATIKLT